MARYRYAGPNPHEVAAPDGDGEVRELIRPGDVFELDEEPPFGPWELVPDEPETDEPETDEPETDGGDPEPPGPQEASPAASGAAPAPSLTAPPVKGF